MFLHGPPLGWVGLAIILGMLFIGLVLYSQGESENPRLKEKYQDGF
ncbi:MAG: hypothetical protein ACFFCO_07350 [Promethearchaeota archaeon]